MICPLCKDPNAVFNRDKTKKSGFKRICQKCCREQSMAWRKKNPEKCKLYNKNRKERKREQDYRRKYGISIDTYEKMLKEQDGSCMICHKAEPQNKRLDIDHCHRTGKIRALLCARCNKTVGLLEDDKNLALKVAYYLDRFEEKDNQNG